MEQVRSKAKQDFVRADRTKAPPDGYTVGLGGIAQNVLAIGSYARLPYDPRADFTFIGGMWQLPNILSGRKDLFSSDLKELLAAFKKEPRKYTYASADLLGGRVDLLFENLSSWLPSVRAGQVKPVAVTARALN
jgi:tripartite-type tricarboxylate transporter receptor subunit TctC